MRIYVAASRYDVGLAEELIGIIQSERMDHTITHDWTASVRAAEQKTAQDMQDAGVNDRQGVRDCELFILLWSDRLLGGLVELGMALDQGKKVWIHDPKVEVQPHVFFCLPDAPVRIINAGWEIVQELEHAQTIDDVTV